ncbi:MAG: hypothetical protein M3N46_04405 [Actinomycetota bacterium]|nr:hypothetical protein [Actinomycetota bacterium]
MTPRSTESDHLTDGRSLEDGAFNVRDFARTAQGSHRGQLDLEAIAVSGLGGDAIRLLRLLRDLERSTMQRLRNLLVTATHKDARVTAFLTTWAFEKFWIADALDAVLEATGDDLHSSAPAGGIRRAVLERQERRGPVARAIQGNIDGPQIVAAHVTTGLVDEWITQAAYRRLGELATGLSSIVELVNGIKDRHIRFLSEEATRRLALSAKARKLATRELTNMVWPVGAVEHSDDDRTFFDQIVFGTENGRAEVRRIQDLIAALPGLSTVAPTISARLIP